MCDIISVESEVRKPNLKSKLNILPEQDRKLHLVSLWSPKLTICHEPYKV